jgi:hypothetical protein
MSRRRQRIGDHRRRFLLLFAGLSGCDYLIGLPTGSSTYFSLCGPAGNGGCGGGGGESSDGSNGGSPSPDAPDE